MTERATSARQFAKNPEKRGDFKNVKGCIGNVKKVIVIGKRQLSSTFRIYLYTCTEPVLSMST